MASNSKSNRRAVNPLSLAFLDVMFCGFGAVILIFLILDHASTVSPEESNPELAAEIDLLEEEVEEELFKVAGVILEEEEEEGKVEVVVVGIGGRMGK